MSRSASVDKLCVMAYMPRFWNIAPPNLIACWHRTATHPSCFPHVSLFTRLNHVLCKASYELAAKLCNAKGVAHNSGSGCRAHVERRAGACLYSVHQGRLRGLPALPQVVGHLLASGEHARILEGRQPLEEGVPAQLQPCRGASGHSCTIRCFDS